MSEQLHLVDAKDAVTAAVQVQKKTEAKHAAKPHPTPGPKHAQRVEAKETEGGVVYTVSAIQGMPDLLWHDSPVWDLVSHEFPRWTDEGGVA